MEGLTRLVAESMARHGIDAPLDYRRLEWSHWFRCQSSLDLVLPSMPGLFALSEELLARGQTPVASGTRVLAVFQISEAQDLEIAINRLFSSNSAIKERIASGRFFIRYTIIEDESQRRAARRSFERWLATSAETASATISEHGVRANEPIIAVAQNETQAQVSPAEDQAPAPLPSGF